MPSAEWSVTYSDTADNKIVVSAFTDNLTSDLYNYVYTASMVYGGNSRVENLHTSNPGVEMQLHHGVTARLVNILLDYSQTAADL